MDVPHGHMYHMLPIDHGKFPREVEGCRVLGHERKTVRQAGGNAQACSWN